MITASDLAALLPRPMGTEEVERADALITLAYEQIRRAFLKQGRDFDTEVTQSQWLGAEADDIVRELVAQAVLIGVNVNVQSVTSTSGPTSDSITYRNTPAVWAGIKLGQQHLAALGLAGYATPRGHGPPPQRWPERRPWKPWKTY